MELKNNKNNINTTNAEWHLHIAPEVHYIQARCSYSHPSCIRRAVIIIVVINKYRLSSIRLYELSRNAHHKPSRCQKVICSYALCLPLPHPKHSNKASYGKNLSFWRSSYNIYRYIYIYYKHNMIAFDFWFDSLVVILVGCLL